MNTISTCKSWIKYSWEGVACEEPSWEGDSEGLCILHSLKAEKDKNTFDQVMQSKLGREDYDFREVFFPGPVSFAKKEFNKPINFSRAKFGGWNARRLFLASVTAFNWKCSIPFLHPFCGYVATCYQSTLIKSIKVFCYG
jgi:hypothetical protein